MASSNDNVSMALFCDFENVALGVRDANYDKFDIKPVLERLLLKGSIVVKKAYCDWDRYKGFKAPMHEANFELIEIPHVRQSGKNSADIRMVVDALDLCYTKSHVDTFVIISGDSDFSPLVSKLRENAKKVIGVGVKQSTSDLLVANCDEFIFYDDLVRESRRAKRDNNSDSGSDAKPAVKRSPEEERARREEMDKRRNQAVEIAANTFEALVSERGDSGKIWASVLKEAIKRRKPDFSESYYGFRTFGNLIEECKARGLLEFGRDEKSGAYVYRSSGAAAASAGSQQGEAQPLDGVAGEAQDAKQDGRQEGKQEGKQDSRRSRGRGRTAAERFADRQAERQAQQARAGSDETSDDAAQAEAAPVVDAVIEHAPYGAWQEAAEGSEAEAQPAAESERGRGRGRGNRGGRKQNERQGGQAGQGAMSETVAAVATAAMDAPVVLEAAVDLPVVAETAEAAAPAKKKSGAKPPARKVKAAAKPKAEVEAPAKPLKSGKGGKGAKPAADVAPAAQAEALVAPSAPSTPSAPAEDGSDVAAKPAKPAKAKAAAAKPAARKPAARAKAVKAED